ncbi:MAG: recombination regulator RecX [Paludibacteraceae bacterium]|nr:recombination regulator RecX [Paludibacteraceae bacterium]
MNRENYIKLSNYCAGVERCKAEVRDKMQRLGIEEEEQAEILKKLEKEGFINEQRYARAFTFDKLRFSKWGKRKIEYALHGKQIPERFISEAIGAIDPEEYEKIRQNLESAKAKTIKGDPKEMKNKAKIFRFMAGRGFIIAALLLCNISLIKAAGGSVFGIAKDYANHTLDLIYEEDGLTHHTVLVDRCTVDSTGHFQFNTNTLVRATKCLLYLGYYKCALFVEPYKDYNVNLPALRLPTEEDNLNPYFKPQEILLSLNNPASDDLNLRITAFDDAFDEAFNRLIKEDITPEKIETEYMKLEYDYGDSDPFFTTYRYCNYAILINLYEPTQPYTAIDAFFMSQPIAYHNPAYWDAFNVLFENYKDISALKDNKPLQELVIIHHVLAKTLPVSALNSIQTPENQAIANRAKERLGIAAKNAYTSVTKIKNIDGEEFDLKDFDSSQIFIIFANSMLGKSLSDVEFAKISNKKWHGRCTVLVIFTDADKAKVDEATSKIGERYFILLGKENKEFIKVFDVKNAPAYFRIDVNGKILESPAPEPKDFSL